MEGGGSNSIRDSGASRSYAAQGSRGGTTRLYFDDDEESFFDLDIETMAPGREEFEFQVSVASFEALGTESPREFALADELFRDGRIVPMEKNEPAKSSGSDPTASPRRSSCDEARTRGHGELRDLFTISSGEIKDFAGRAGKISEKEKRQKIIETRRVPFSSISTMLTNGVIKFLIKFPSEKIRLAFMSLARSPQQSPTPSPTSTGGHSVSAARTRARPPLHRSLFTPIYSWFTTRSRVHSSDQNGRSWKPKVMEIKGDSRLMGILDTMSLSPGNHDDKSKNRKGDSPLSRRPRSAQSSPRPSWSRDDKGGYHPWSRPSSAQSSPQRGSAGAYVREGVVDRAWSISSAVDHCKRSYREDRATP